MVKKSGNQSYEFSRADSRFAKTVATVVEPVESFEVHKSVAEDLQVKEPEDAKEVIEENTNNEETTEETTEETNHEDNK